MPEPTNKLNICLIGYGSIGKDVYKKIHERGLDDIEAVDKRPGPGVAYNSVSDYCAGMIERGKRPDVFIIAVWSPAQVLEVCKDIVPYLDSVQCTSAPLISVETTAAPGLYKNIREIVGDIPHVVLFQERFNPNDDAHGTFNQPMVMCGDYEHGRKFWTRYMMYENIVVTDNIEMAEISHLVDNSVRYVDIAMAEELQLLVGSKENFDELRRLCNTKWNINIMETRTGIGGHCLKKDIQEINKALPKNKIFNLAFAINTEFEKQYGE